MPHVIASVVQAGSYLFDTKRTLNAAVDLIQHAARQGAQLIVAPEALLGGYPKGLAFGVQVGIRSAEGRDEFRRYWEAAIDVPGPETETLADLAAELDVHLVVGVVERSGGTLYCTALFFGPGGLLAKHRKLMPTAAERYIWGCGDGSTMPAVSIGPATIGAAICWENYMPLFRTAMYSKGLDIWCAPTVDDRDTWQTTMRHIALESRCFVLAACQFQTRDRVPANLHSVQGDDPETVIINGGSVMISPLGEVLAGPLRGKEGILVAELDLGDIARARFDFDATGHYARPDVFTLLVDQRARASVTEPATE